MLVYQWCHWPFYGLETVEDEVELFSEITPETQSQLNIRLKDGDSVIISEDQTVFYKC